MTTSTIQVQEALLARAQATAARQGESVEALVEAFLEAYLEDQADLEAIEEARAAIARGEEEWVDWETVKAELDL